MSYDFSEGAGSGALKITNDNFMQMKKETLCFVSMFSFLLSLSRSQLVFFLSILMKIICKQSSVFHSENCFFNRWIFCRKRKLCCMLWLRGFLRQINMSLLSSLLLCRWFLLRSPFCCYCRARTFIKRKKKQEKSSIYSWPRAKMSKSVEV